MSLAEASDAVTQRLPVRQGEGSCHMIQPHALPTGVSLMVEHDTVVRVDVESALAATDSGARVGITEDSLRAIYHNHLREQPHKYNPAPWRYLIFEPHGDTLHRIVFESDGHRIRAMRGGARPAVEYSEKCG